MGDGTTTYRAKPVRVKGLGKVRSIATGSRSTCATLVTGAVKCWGANYEGQLGNGTTQNSSVPVQVAGLTSGWTQVATGDGFACATNAAGSVKCWGANGAGQLGNGSSQDHSTRPVSVSGLSRGVTQLAASGYHACALSAAGGLKCWGSNLTGSLGVGPTIDESRVPVQVLGMTRGVTAVAGEPGAGHTCAVLESGAAKCWGHNYTGQVGNGTTSYAVRRPTQVVGLTSGVSGISVGGATACANQGGRLLCWGDGARGGLGTGDKQDSVVPKAVKVLTSGVTQLNTGSGGCAVKAAQVYCWGAAASGDLFSYSLVPKLLEW